MRNEKIFDFLTLSGRYSRSISLARDVYDDEAINGYLLTPNSVSALRQLGEGIAGNGTQRAWKVVGPYGSGKSALGVLSAQLLAGADRYPSASKLLGAASPEVADLFRQSDRLALAVVGARMSFGNALAVAMDAAAQQLGKARPVTAWRRNLDLHEGAFRGRPLNAVAGEMASEFSAAVRSSGKYAGVALLIDEVGKFVEHAALYPEQGDLIALQQVAEAACVARDDKLLVVAMLHQHFASYAAGVGRALNDEWHKVAARFEEIAFDEPLERYAHFARHALGVTPELTSNRELAEEAKRLFSWALAQGVLRSASPADRELFDEPISVYPLHPLTLSAIATVSKRYGQSERSFHVFLKGNEPGGLRDFALTAPVGAWYRLADLYDYLSGGYGLRFRDLEAERRWFFAQSAIDRIVDDELASAILKSVAVLELAHTGTGFTVTREAIEYAIGKEGLPEVAIALDRLVEQGVLFKRRRGSEYCIAVSEAVNVEALYERAAKTSEGELIVRGIAKALTKRHVVANRHYDETGTIRTMGILVGTVDAWPQVPSGKDDDSRPDGWLKLVFVGSDCEAEVPAVERIKADTDPLCLSACVAISTEARAALAELAIWQTVLREVTSKRLDPWTTRYVEGRLQSASEAVEKLVSSVLTPAQERQGLNYWHLGELVPGSTTMNVSQLASWLFGKAFPQTPRVVNELINKDKPTSAIVLARQRMFDVILSGDPKRKICGESEFPPERLIHTTLLRDTGMWHESEGRWRLTAPCEVAHVDISPVWAKISALLSRDALHTFAELLETLAAPPFGVRAGPAGIWIALYLLINRGRCAVFERGSLVLELTSEHLQRMYKNPQVFAMRELDVDTSADLLGDYRSALSSVGCGLEADATYLDLARTLYRWFSRLPEFTKQTALISKDAAVVRTFLDKATDPIKLLTETLPHAHREANTLEPFAAWLRTALTDLGEAYRRLQDAVERDLAKGLGMNGSLNRIRSQLQAECSREASTLADVNLRSFILRCSDPLLTDERWLESIGGLVVQRPLDSWTDDSLIKFREGLTELCAHYKRWMKLVMQRGQAPDVANRFVGLTVMLPSGEEKSVFVTTSESSAAMAKELLAIATAGGDYSAETASAALAQALLDLQRLQHDRAKEDVCNG